jgi:2-methylcitrate dehydratase PrpD
MKLEDGVNVEVVLKNGKKYAKKTWPPRGAPDNPPSEDELTAKFKNCARYGGLGEKEIQKVIDFTLTLEELDDICEITKLVS